MSKISKVKARQVFDSRGNPTIEAEVFVKNQSAIAICPSGASTGTYEAFEKRDKNNKRYLGKSVLNAINLVNTKISNKLKGQSVHNSSVRTINYAKTLRWLRVKVSLNLIKSAVLCLRGSRTVYKTNNDINNIVITNAYRIE